jgi:Holliday junction resolvase
MTRYEIGRAKEYKAIEILRKTGWLVSRSAASHSPVDLFAGKDGKILLVQVKSGRARVKKEELEELIRWGKNFNGDAEVWHFKRRGTLEKRTVHRAKRAGAAQ